MIPVGDSEFLFDCHKNVECFNVCCRKVDLTLYPYDILRLKNCLKIDSEQFLRSYTILAKGNNAFFPSVMIKLADDEEKSCPFLGEEGCTVYHDRPSACRTYPLERAVDRSEQSAVPDDFYFLVNHDYCKGHNEDKSNTVNSWVRSQRLIEFNTMNSLWAGMDTLFATNPWKGEGAAGEKQQLAFMVCYNIDGFRRFCHQHQILKQFRLDKQTRRRIDNEDGELLKFGFDWLRLVLTGRSSLVKK